MHLIMFDIVKLRAASFKVYVLFYNYICKYIQIDNSCDKVPKIDFKNPFSTNEARGQEVTLKQYFQFRIFKQKNTLQSFAR